MNTILLGEFYSEESLTLMTNRINMFASSIHIDTSVLSLELFLTLPLAATGITQRHADNPAVTLS